MIRKFLYIASLCAIIFGSLAGSVSAHVYLTVGPMEIFSHIDPDDDPIIGEEAKLFFIFAHANNKFDSKLCDCVVNIKTNNGKKLFTTKLFTIPDPSVSEFDYTFDSRGVYDIEVIGKPLPGAAFEAFEAHRIIRVERISLEIPEPEESVNLGFILLFSIAFAVIVLLFVLESARSKKSKIKGNSTTGFLVIVATASLLGLSFHEVKAMELVGQMNCHEVHECCKIQAIQDSSFVRVADNSPFTGAFDGFLPTHQQLISFSADIQDRSPPFIF